MLIYKAAWGSSIGVWAVNYIESDFGDGESWAAVQTTYTVTYYEASTLGVFADDSCLSYGYILQ